MRLPAPSCPQVSPSATTPVGNTQSSEPIETESERQVIATLIDIAAEGDKAIVKLNACVSAYEEVRRIVNGQ